MRRTLLHYQRPGGSGFAWNLAWDTAFGGYTCNLAAWAIVAVTTSEQFEVVLKAAHNFAYACERALKPKEARP